MREGEKVVLDITFIELNLLPPILVTSITVSESLSMTCWSFSRSVICTFLSI